MAIDLAPRNTYGLRLNSPVIAAAGCLGYGIEYQRLLDLNRLGALVTRSSSYHSRRPAAEPRLLETPSGLLHTLDSFNPGLRQLVAQYAPVWARWKLPVIVSLAADALDAMTAMVQELDGLPGIAGFELSLPYFAEPAEGLAVLRQLRSQTTLPIMVKLALDTPEPLKTARQVVDLGADALVLAAGPVAVAADAQGQLISGRLAGPALRPLALYMLSQIAAHIQDVPLISGGGIISIADARIALAHGAVAVQIGSALLNEPRIAEQIATALAAGSTTR